MAGMSSDFIIFLLFQFGLAASLPFQITEISESFLCGGSLPRLPKSTLCDGYPDCPYGEDEFNCQKETHVDSEDKWRKPKLEKDQQVAVDLNVWNPMIIPDSGLKQKNIQKVKENIDHYQQQRESKEALIVNRFNPFDLLLKKGEKETLPNIKSQFPCLKDGTNSCKGDRATEWNKHRLNSKPNMIGSFNPFNFLISKTEKKPEIPTSFPQHPNSHVHINKIPSKWGEFPKERMLEEKLGSLHFDEIPAVPLIKNTFEVYTALPSTDHVETSTKANKQIIIMDDYQFIPITSLPKLKTPESTTTSTLTITYSTTSTSTTTTTSSFTTTITSTSTTTTASTSTTTSTTATPSTTTSISTTTSTTTPASTTSTTTKRPEKTTRITTYITTSTTATPSTTTSISTTASTTTPASTTSTTTKSPEKTTRMTTYTTTLSKHKQISTTPKALREDEKIEKTPKEVMNATSSKATTNAAENLKKSQVKTLVYAYYLDEPCTFTSLGCKMPYDVFNKMVKKTKTNHPYPQYGYPSPMYGQYRVPYYGTWYSRRIRRF